MRVISHKSFDFVTQLQPAESLKKCFCHIYTMCHNRRNDLNRFRIQYPCRHILTWHRNNFSNMQQNFSSAELVKMFQLAGSYSLEWITSLLV